MSRSNPYAHVKRAGKYRSQFEAEMEKSLEGEEAEYEEIRIPYSVTLLANYIPDWILRTQAVLLEVKGYFPAEDRTKMLRIKASYPDLDIRLVLQTPDNKIGKKLTYAGWAEKHGFPWCKGPGIPDSWLKNRPTASARAAFDAVVQRKKGGTSNVPSATA